MRRLSGLIILPILALSLLSLPVFGQGSFATRTPTPEPETENNSQFAEESGSRSSFSTNTPLPPTATVTPSPTLTPIPTDTPTSTPSPTPEPIGPITYPEGFNPLTGLPYPNEEAMSRRNLIVKISNFPPIVRPQTGVNQADVVYEYEAEGGVTRFAAIFRSNNPGEVGSIRSARLIDLELLTMYNALLGYSGTSEPIQQILINSEFKWQIISPLIGHNCEEAGFCRKDLPDRAFEHTLFGDTNGMWAIADRQNVNIGMRARGFAFDDQPSPGGMIANDIFIDWFGETDARWQYDPETGRYLRFTDGVIHIDKGDGQQLWTDNLIAIEVPHARRPDLFPPGVNYESIEIQLWDQGRALVFRDGIWHQGFWRRKDREPGSALQVIFGNNDPIMLKPGRTWVAVVRWLGDVVPSEQYADMRGTATAIALSATPTPSPTTAP